MRGLGTLINVLCILLGGIAGSVFKNHLNARMQESLMTVTGVAVIFLGIGGTLDKLLALTNAQTIMMILSLALGTLIGEILDIEGKVVRFGEWLKQKSNQGNDASFVNAFVTASCTVCIGAMAVVGAIEDGIYGDYSVLLAKGILDAIIICIMSASQGRGCIFSAIPVALFQGSITIIAMFAGSFMSATALSNLSLVGSILIFCVGLNLILTQQIRVANLLPSLIVAAVWGIWV